MYKWQPLHSLSKKCIVVSLLCKSALKLVVIWSITSIHMKNSVGIKNLLKWSSHKGTTRVDGNILIEKSHLRLIPTSVVKKKNRKIKKKSKQWIITIKQNLSVRVKSLWCTSNWVLKSVQCHVRSPNYN